MGTEKYALRLRCLKLQGLGGEAVQFKVGNLELQGLCRGESLKGAQVLSPVDH